MQILMHKKFKLITPVNYGYQKCPPSNPAGPLVRDFWLLHYVLAGEGEYRASGTTYKISPGKCFIIRPSEPHFYISDKEHPWTLVWIGFRSEIKLPDIFNEQLVFDAFSLEDVFLSVLNAPQGDKKEAWVAGKIFELLTLLGEHDRLPEAKLSPAEHAKKQLEERHININIEELAREMHFNRSYLNVLFKNEYGTSMQNYLVNYRLNRAAKLMQELGYSPTQAAAAVGYSDIYCFSKLFKKHIGISPAEYKKRSEKWFSFSIDNNIGL